MIVEVKVPEVGESITEGLLVEWSQGDGAQVQYGDPLFELETDKITLTVSAEQGGQLSILVAAETEVTVGQVVGKIDTAQAAEPVKVEVPQTPGPPIAPQSGVTMAYQTLDTAKAHGTEALSPAVRRLVAQHELDPGQLQGSGKGGRVTKQDVLQHLAAPPAPAAAAAAHAAPEDAAAQPRVAAPARPETRTRMSRLRQRIAERLLSAQQNAAILSTFNEADMSSVMDLRSRLKEAFVQRHGVKLGLTSFFVKAVVDALVTVPALNGRIDGDEIVQPEYYDIGVAVGTPQGLIVPVLRDADQLSFAEVELAIADYARRARERKLTLNELSGGTFTISNGGVYGSLLSTPILNPPQSGILGLHNIKQRAVVVDDEVVARPMMYLAVSYDHRLVDGEQAVTFLRRVVECIEDPERLMLGA